MQNFGCQNVTCDESEENNIYRNVSYLPLNENNDQSNTKQQSFNETEQEQSNLEEHTITEPSICQLIEVKSQTSNENIMTLTPNSSSNERDNDAQL